MAVRWAAWDQEMFPLLNSQARGLSTVFVEKSVDGWSGIELNN